MTPERFRQVERVYQDALAHEGPERATFLADACAADLSLRFEVEALLAHAAPAAASFLVRPAMEVAAHHLAAAAHTITTGTTIGPYAILSRLGAGGMGEVYRARDTKLGREVAIKILPRLFTGDRERLARLEREARMLASLNHPHIGAIYGVEDMDGTPALILELVDGDTLAERIAKGPLSIGEALNIARQVADATEAAHEKGIVHRDLKPANIKITPDGIVKVLDFGLAKAALGDASGPDLTQSPTLTAGSTRVGVILGTAAYMSPEQARGKVVDKRTDLWAFGCVLYEMLTGRSAFASETISDTIARILERDPDWGALPAATPPTITRLVRRCLEKDPKRRWHDIADARIEIEDVVSGAVLSSGEAAAVLPRQRPVRLPWMIAVLASLVALVAAGALTWYVWTTRQAQISLPEEIASSGPARILPAYNRNLAITPDGTYLVYAGNNGRLFRYSLDPSLDRPDPTEITTTTAPVNYVFVSPDSRSVGFAQGGTLKKVALTGGPAMTILDTRTGNSGGATWEPKDTIIFATNDETATNDEATGLQRVSADGVGNVAVLTRPKRENGESDHLWPEMLPGGREVLFTITATTGGLDAAQVAVLNLDKLTYTVLIPGGSHAHYVKSGHLVYTARGTLFAVPFDLDRPDQPLGTPVTVLPRLRRTPLGAGDFVVSANGTLAYVDAADYDAERNRLVRVYRTGGERSLPGAGWLPRLSPDGSRVAFFTGLGPALQILDFAQQKPSQVAFDHPLGHSLVWTGPDLLFNATDGLIRQAADGTGAAKRLGVSGFVTGVTPNGKQVLFNSGGDMKMLTLDGGLVEALTNEAALERNGVVSPNGRWLAYQTNISGKFEINVRSFPNVSAGAGWIISSGTQPLWAPTEKGQELFWVAPDGAIMAVRYDALGAKWTTLGRPETIIEGGAYANGGPLTTRSYDVFPDGQSFLMVKQDAAKIIVVRNWVDKLKRLVPTR